MFKNRIRAQWLDFMIFIVNSRGVEIFKYHRKCVQIIVFYIISWKLVPLYLKKKETHKKKLIDCKLQIITDSTAIGSIFRKYRSN